MTRRFERTRTVAVMAFVTMVVACIGTDVPDDSVDRAAIASMIAAGIDATRNKDLEAYMAQIPEGITLHDEAGNPLTRTELRDRVLAAWERIERTRHLDVVIDTIMVKGDSALVYTTQTWDRLVVRPDTAVVDTVVSVASQREVWHRTAEGWRAFDVIYLSGATRVNGSLLFQPPGG